MRTQPVNMQSPSGHWMRSGKKGAGDVLMTPTCRTGLEIVWIETKSKNGRHAIDQQEFQWQVEAAGHFYLKVKVLEQVQDWLKEHGAL